MIRFRTAALALTFCSLAGPAAASDFVLKTWVSGLGTDTNFCGRSDPCATFAAAMALTVPGGEIGVLDPGDYGGLTIAKSLTISGDNTLAAVTVRAGSAFVISGDGVMVTLRNLTISGVPPRVENGISVGGGASVFIDRVRISGFHTGVETTGGTVTLLNSTLTHNGLFGVHAIGGTILLENSALVKNGVAVRSDTGATVRLANNAIYSNLTGLACGGGTLVSAGNNRKANNVGGSEAVCAPNAAMAVQ